MTDCVHLEAHSEALENPTGRCTPHTPVSMAFPLHLNQKLTGQYQGASLKPSPPSDYANRRFEALGKGKGGCFIQVYLLPFLCSIRMN